MDSAAKTLLAIVSAIITVAIVAVIVSKKSDTAGLVQSLGTSLSKLISAAVTPLPSKNGIVSIAGSPTLVDLNALVHGDISTSIAPLF